MEFFYPNFLNDMWRIVGLLFFDDKRCFEVQGQKRFDVCRVTEFCEQRGIALFDTACAVRRLKANASDAQLEVAVPTDIAALLSQIPECATIVTTGEKATDTLCERLDCPKPAVGECVEAHCGSRPITVWRMPSSSRAYPLAIERKAELYSKMFRSAGLL